MRSLERNMQNLWLVSPTTYVPLLDSEGFDTGETTVGYSTPIEIAINIYPSNGRIVQQIFGNDISLDLLALSTDIVLDKRSLLFLNEPTSNFGTTYDYEVTHIKHSINSYNYGLRNRT